MQLLSSLIFVGMKSIASVDKCRGNVGGCGERALDSYLLLGTNSFISDSFITFVSLPK
jgi:hypothetical protein